MLARMGDHWLWLAALIDFAVSSCIAQILVRCGIRWSYMLEHPMDASSSIASFTIVLGVTLPLVALVLGVMLFSPRSTADAHYR